MFDYLSDLAVFAPPAQMRKPAACKRVFNRDVLGQEVSRVERLMEYFRGEGLEIDLSRPGLERFDAWFATQNPELDADGRLSGAWTTWAIDVALAIGEVVQRELNMVGEWRLFPAIQDFDPRCTPGLWIGGPDYPGQPIGYLTLTDVYLAACGVERGNRSPADSIVSSNFAQIDLTFPPHERGGEQVNNPLARSPEVASEEALERYRIAMSKGTQPLEGIVLLADVDPHHLSEALDDEDPRQPPNPKLIRFLDDFYRRWPDVPMGLDVEVPPPYEYNLYEMITGNQLAVGLTSWAPKEMSDDLVSEAHKRGLLVYDTVTGSLI